MSKQLKTIEDSIAAYDESLLSEIKSKEPNLIKNWDYTINRWEKESANIGEEEAPLIAMDYVLTIMKKLDIGTLSADEKLKYFFGSCHLAIQMIYADGYFSSVVMKNTLIVFPPSMGKNLLKSYINKSFKKLDGGLPPLHTISVSRALSSLKRHPTVAAAKEFISSLTELWYAPSEYKEVKDIEKEVEEEKDYATALKKAIDSILKDYPSLHQQLLEAAQAIMKFAQTEEDEDAVLLKSIFTDCYDRLSKKSHSDEKQSRIFKPDPKRFKNPKKFSPTSFGTDYEGTELNEGRGLAAIRETGADYTTIINPDAPIYKDPIPETKLEIGIVVDTTNSSEKKEEKVHTPIIEEEDQPLLFQATESDLYEENKNNTQYSNDINSKKNRELKKIIKDLGTQILDLEKRIDSCCSNSAARENLKSKRNKLFEIEKQCFLIWCSSGEKNFTSVEKLIQNYKNDKDVNTFCKLGITSSWSLFSRKTTTREVIDEVGKKLEFIKRS